MNHVFLLLLQNKLHLCSTNLFTYRHYGSCSPNNWKYKKCNTFNITNKCFSLATREKEPMETKWYAKKNIFPLKKGYKVQLVCSWIISNPNQLKIALHETETLAFHFVIFLVVSSASKEFSRELCADVQL